MYAYDALNRLSTAVSSAGTYTGLTLTESYDAYGNRENQVPSGTYGGPVPQPSLLTFSGNNNRADQWSYDAAGDVLYDGTNAYEYDAEGRQTGVLNTLNGLTGYIYDAEGNRVMKVVVNGFGGPDPTTTVTNEYLLGPNGEQVSVLDGSGTWQWTNVYAGAKQLASYDSAGTHFTVTDWLGTKRMQLGVTAASTVTVGEQCASLPYGDGLNCTGSDVNHLYFTGKERDTESGNDYFLARYYSSNQGGRFLTPDWSKNPQGVPYADYTNPQTLNLYAYVGNNPLSLADLDGHGGCTDTASATCAQITKDVANGVDTSTEQRGVYQQQQAQQQQPDGNSLMAENRTPASPNSSNQNPTPSSSQNNGDLNRLVTTQSQLTNLIEPDDTIEALATTIVVPAAMATSAGVQTAGGAAAIMAACGASDGFGCLAAATVVTPVIFGNDIILLKTAHQYIMDVTIPTWKQFLSH